MRVTIPRAILPPWAPGHPGENTGGGIENDLETAILCGRRLDDGDVLQAVGVWDPLAEEPERIGPRLRSHLGTSVDLKECHTWSQYYQVDPTEGIDALIPITISTTIASNLLDMDAIDAIVVVEGPSEEDQTAAERVTLKTDTTDNDGADSPVNDVDIISYEADAFSRNEGLLDSDLLADTVVTVVGLGTGGGTVAVELAKAGVGSFRLVDFDRLETHNITRHVCGLSDIGRKKTSALRDRLLDINPTLEVTTFDIDIVEQESADHSAIDGSDLVIGATDSEVSKLAINRMCVTEDIPAIYAGAYERAFGGDVIRVIPNETPCYDCVLGDLQESLDYTDETEAIDYADVEDPENFTAEPGLSSDVGFISLIQTNYALVTLLRETESDLEDYDENMCFWGNRPEWIFEEPLQSQFAETRFRDDCPTCQRDVYFEENLGMTESEAQEKAKDIVSDADEMEIQGIEDGPPGEEESE